MVTEGLINRLSTSKPAEFTSLAKIMDLLWKIRIKACLHLIHPVPVQHVSNELEAPFKVRYVNANDRTVEGLDLIGKRAFTIQYHPEACPGPHDASPLFDRFASMVDDHLAGIPIPNSRGDN